jgi:hypothetical protein
MFFGDRKQNVYSCRTQSISSISTAKRSLKINRLQGFSFWKKSIFIFQLKVLSKKLRKLLLLC